MISIECNKYIVIHEGVYETLAVFYVTGMTKQQALNKVLEKKPEIYESDLTIYEIEDKSFFQVLL